MNKTTIGWFVIALAVGLGLGYGLFSEPASNTPSASSEERTPLFYRNPMNPTVTSPVPAKDSMGMDYIAVYADAEDANQERTVLFYRNPMNPTVTSPVPAKDSMGMDYVPVYADNEAGADVTGTVKIDPVVVQNIGVRTAVAEKRSLSRNIKTVGRVDFNETRMARLHPKVDGWIEEIRVDETGQRVTADDILLSFYSPKLVSAQQEYLLALNNEAALSESPFEQIRDGAKDLSRSARERLQLWDVPSHQIRELEQSRTVKKNIHIHAPWSGTVLSIGARAGQFVTPSTELYMMVDLSEVWVFADVYEYEIPWVKVGDQVEMTLASVPGRVFKGSLDHIYPYAEAKTRTTKVRLVFDNEDRALRPDMFADVSIFSDRQDEAVVIPAEAVVRSGDHTQAFVVIGDGKFEPRDIRIGIESKGFVTVLDGIHAGEAVVTSAQFLVDSESKLKEATAKMMDSLSQGAASVPESGQQPQTNAMSHDHHTMETGDKSIETGEPRHD
ncbi:MAG: efflux RND transporter periplasmic adaptor subunit [Pseudomonadota bacterium]